MLREADQLIGKDGRHDHQCEREAEDEQRQDEKRGDEPVETQAVQLLDDGVEQIAEREAHGEGRHDAAEQLQREGERDDDRRPYQELTLEAHFAPSGEARSIRIPFAAERVGEHGDGSIRFAPRRLEKAHAPLSKGFGVAPKIVGLEKIADPPARGLADRPALAFVNGLGENEACAALALGGDNDPPLARAEINVLNEGEAERAAKPGDGLVVFGDHERDRGEAAGQGRLP